MCKMFYLDQLCLRWRMWIRPIIICVYGLFVIIIVPLLIVNSVKDGFTRKDQLILIGGLFVLTAIPVSIWHITQHIVHYTKPILQKHIIRILWMVPIYAMNAWLGLIYPQHSIYMNSIRECYEAYVIYNFMVYLLNYLNLEMDLEVTLELKAPVKHIFPLCCMHPWEMGREFVHNCKHGILQYTVVRLITTFISVICEICGVYGESTFAADVAYPYIIFVNNISQFIAMYCLVLFYKANKTELKPMKPVPKFLCIKAVIFFSFFQGVIITFLVYFGYIKDIFSEVEDSDYKILSSKLQDFLICIEMFLAAVAHHYSFPHYPFHINSPHYSGSDGSWYDAFVAMFNISDVQQDVSEHIGVVGSSLSRRFRGRSTYHMARGITSSEADHLIPIDSTSMYYQSSQLQNEADSLGKSDADNLMPTKRDYGSLNHQLLPSKNDGITIVNKQSQNKDYSPQFGAPKIENYFQKPGTSASSLSIQVDKSNYSENTTPSPISEQFKDLASGDSESIPSDEIIGINVKGKEKDRINFTKYDPNA